MTDLFTCFDSDDVRFAVLIFCGSHTSGVSAKVSFGTDSVSFLDPYFVVDVDTDEGLEVADVLNVSKTPQLRLYLGSKLIAQAFDPQQFPAFLR